MGDKNTLKPTLVINAETSTDDLVELFEKGVDELYTMESIALYISQLGFIELAGVLLVQSIH